MLDRNLGFLVLCSVRIAGAGPARMIGGERPPFAFEPTGAGAYVARASRFSLTVGASESALSLRGLPARLSRSCSRPAVIASVRPGSVM